MKKIIQITYKTIKLPIRIIIDGKTYPNHKRNFDVIREYETNKDEKVLDKLNDISLDLT